MLVYARMIVGQVPWSRDVCSTRPSDQGCLYRRLAFVLPSTASLHSHRVPADKLSTQPGTLDQGCLYCRLAFVLPWTVSSYSHWVPADKLSTQPVLWIKGVGAADQSWRSPIACDVALSTRCLQTKPGPWDQGCLCGRPALVLVLTRLLWIGVSVQQTSLGAPPCLPRRTQIE